MNSEEYEILDFKATDFQDQNGNTWCNVAFVGISEPVKWVVKDPTKITNGGKVYGRITDETSKAGKPYRRFRREKAPETSHVADKEDKPTAEYWDNKQSQIKAQWAIGQAVSLHKELGSKEDFGVKIESTAKELFAMVDRVANPIDENDRDIINLHELPL